MSPCRRGCCWTPFGHAATVTDCPCHDDEEDDPVTDATNHEEHDTADPLDEVSVTVAEFMVRNGLSEMELAELLREYRSESGYSGFQMFAFDRLDSEFINWCRWERLA